MDIGFAIRALRDGGQVSRNAWELPELGRWSQHLVLLREGSVRPRPDDVGAAKALAGAAYGDHIALITYLGGVEPWSASHADLLATDWVQVA